MICPHVFYEHRNGLGTFLPLSPSLSLNQWLCASAGVRCHVCVGVCVGLCVGVCFISQVLKTCLNEN